MPYKRFLPPAYDDGVSSPRLLASSGKTPLPNARIISLTMSIPQAKQRLENFITHITPIFGQFLAHDVTGTAGIVGKKKIDYNLI